MSTDDRIRLDDDVLIEPKSSEDKPVWPWMKDRIILSRNCYPLTPLKKRKFYGAAHEMKPDAAALLSILRAEALRLTSSQQSAADKENDAK